MERRKTEELNPKVQAILQNFGKDIKLGRVEQGKPVQLPGVSTQFVCHKVIKAQMDGFTYSIVIEENLAKHKDTTIRYWISGGKNAIRVGSAYLYKQETQLTEICKELCISGSVNRAYPKVSDFPILDTLLYRPFHATYAAVNLAKSSDSDKAVVIFISKLEDISYYQNIKKLCNIFGLNSSSAPFLERALSPSSSSKFLPGGKPLYLGLIQD